MAARDTRISGAGRRRRLVTERVRVANSMPADHQAAAPGLLRITRGAATFGS